MEHVLEESIPGIKIKKKNNNINLLSSKFIFFKNLLCFI